jgi:site-specific recombinase
MSSVWDFTALVNAADPGAPAPEQNLWLARLLEWLRHAPRRADAAARMGEGEGHAGGNGGDRGDARGNAAGSERGTPWPVRRLRLLCSQLSQHEAPRARLQALVEEVLRRTDLAALFADFGFAERPTLGGEFVARLQSRWLPATPDTNDGAALFALWLRPEDATWLQALDDETLARIAALCPQVDMREALLDAVTTLASHLHSIGHGAGLRRRMDATMQGEQNPFRALPRDVADLREALAAGHVAAALPLANGLRARLQACRAAADSVTEHLENHGVSIAIVHAQELVRLRCERIEMLLDVLLAPERAPEWRRLVLALLALLEERRGVGSLLRHHYALLARRVAERNAETGTHYITRTRAEYRDMLRRAGGGGCVIAGTTFAKFAIAAVGLSAFWGGFWAGINYATSFVLVMLLHWTVATKQPAMTAPALAASLPRGTGLRHAPDAAAVAEIDAELEGFVDRVAQLIRSQTAGVIGNVGTCVPLVLLLQWLVQQFAGVSPLDAHKARAVLDSISLLGPTPLYAAFTGVILFASSLVAGWVENWFVLHRLDSALALNPRIVSWLGAVRAARWADWWRHNVSGVAANVSLGMLLGLVPPLLAFVGLPLDVRHVTLASGQVASAALALGADVLTQPVLWWCVAGIVVVGLLNVGISFWLAFQLALRSRGVRVHERARIRAAIKRRLWQRPSEFFWPPREENGPPA